MRYLLTTLTLFITTLVTFPVQAKKIQLEAHRPIYLGLADYNESEYKNVEFQISFKSRLLWDIYGAYTQKSFWDTYAPSAPFREHNHNPEIYWEREGFSFGYEHESNGVDADDRRSWERVYTKYEQTFAMMTVSGKTWMSFFTHENRDIPKYFGTWETAVHFDLQKIKLDLVNRIKSSIVRITWDFGDFAAFFSSRNGYGHSGMIRYDEPTYSTIGGIALVY